ncbi:MAG: hypothetical protein IPM54_44130 [Polyangiaceae bacterium]|nr:hypothetical protein [Polyangiaceae bacterium]
MKNISFALTVTLFGLLAACSSTQETAGAAAPPPTVTVPPTQSSEPVAEQPTEQKPPVEEAAPPEEQPGAGGRLAFQQCSEESRKMRACTKDFRPVCGEVDTGVRCVRAPCPMSTAQQTFSNACMACVDAKVRGYWPMSCDEMAKPTAP